MPTSAGSHAIAPLGLYERNRARPFLGSISCSRTSLIAGEWAELIVVYEVGEVGLADGAGVKLAFKFYSDWALFQVSDPQAANHVSAEYHAGSLVPGQSPATVQALKVRFDQKGHERPYQKALVVDVIDGYLNPGDRIVIRLGDRRQGGPGTRVQSFVEKGFRLRAFIDPLGSSKFAEVPGDCVIDILPGPPSLLRIIAPRLASTRQPVALIVRADDAWGNTCVDASVNVQLVLTGPGSRRQLAVPLAEAGWAIARLADLALDEAGEWHLIASAIDAPAISPGQAYLTIEDGGEVPHVLYGDLHVHSNDTVGTNDTAYNLSYGRDVAGLDVLGYTANDFNVTRERWDAAVALIATFNAPGRFVCYPGTEWCGNSSAGGDHNVVFLRDDPPLFPLDGKGAVVRSFEWNESTRGILRRGAWPVDELYAAYAHDPEGHLLIPHVGGRRCNLDWHHPDLERLIEITSAWGQFHWLYGEALKRGYRLGASASSDEHQGRCGGGSPGTSVFGSRGGLTGIVSDGFTRLAVGRSLRARHTFATTGERTFASLRSATRWMGDVLTAQPGQQLRYRLLGDAGWEEVVLFDADRIVWQRDLHQESGLSQRRIRLRLGGARIKDRYRGAYWQGSISVVGAVIQDIAAFGFDHPEQTCWREDATTVGLRSVTHGDTDSIELALSHLAGARIAINLQIGAYVKVGDPLQHSPHVHAPEIVESVSGDELLRCDRIVRTLPGVELEVAIERITECALPRECTGAIEIDQLRLAHRIEHPLFIMGRQRDQSRTWTSPLFLTSEGN
jgi:hypothetical protein